MNTRNTSDEFPAIGHNVRKERMQKDWTLQELASVSGLSKAMLSQIEANKVNPTIATLWKIAQAMQIDLDRIISGAKNKKSVFEVTRNSQQLHFAMDDGCTLFTILTPPNLSEDLEIYRVVLKAGATHQSKPHARNTMEFVRVQKGRVQIKADDRDCILEEGDFIMMHADVIHSLVNLSNDDADLFMVVRFSK